MALAEHWPDAQRWDDPLRQTVVYPMLELWVGDSCFNCATGFAE